MMNEYQMMRLNTLINKEQQGYLKHLIRIAIGHSYINYSTIFERVVHQLKERKEDSEAQRAIALTKQSLRYLLMDMVEANQIAKFTYNSLPFVEYGPISSSND